MIGQKAFELFKKRHNTKLSAEYPSLMIKDVDVNINEFNPNKNYLTFKYKDNFPSSPFHFITLIPSESKLEQSSLLQCISFFHFLNWACYFYPKLKSDYAKINSPSPKQKKDAKIISKELAEIITQLSPDEEKQITDKRIKEDVKNNFKKNNKLKPTKFLSLCRFYARAWFDENFEAENSIKFAYYVNCYIENNENPDNKKCAYYKKKRDFNREVAELFTTKENKSLKTQMSYIIKNFTWSTEILDKKIIYYIVTNINDIDYRKYGFFIQINRTYNNEKKYTYSISISQTGCSHYFYKFARLHLQRYSSIFTPTPK